MSTTPSMTRMAQQEQQQQQQQRPFKPLLTKLRNSFGYSSNGESSSSSSSDASGSDSEGDSGVAVAVDGPVRKLPQCWGHRGASAAFPENTLASFKQAILDGAEGIESDVHVSKDNTIVMFHDAYLNRTTNGKGLISKQAFKDGIDQLRTTKLPAQRICTFAETLELLMRPENRHVVLNVDVKLDNDPEVLYPLMREEIERFDDWETELAPRLILGLWHAKYIAPAQQHLPYCGLAHIGVSPSVALKYFWSSCSAFSLNYASLVAKEGQDFVAKCQKEGKDLYVWTVNDRKQMIQATKWGAKAILTDRTADFLSLRGEMSRDWNAISKEVTPIHAWSNVWHYSVIDSVYQAWETFLLHRTAGPMVLPPHAVAVEAKIKITTAAAPAAGSDTTIS